MTARPSASLAGSAPSQIRMERDRFVALSFCWADLLFELDIDRRVVYAAGALKPLIGLGTDDVLEKPIDTLVSAAERPILHDLLARAQRRERIDNAALRLTGPNGITPPLAFAAYQLQDLSGHFFVGLRYSQPQRKAAGFGRRARDEETGLIDADAFADIVTDQLATCGSGEERCMSLIVLPQFETLRSRLVEAAEKELLSAIGARLQENAADSESAARLGPDRFGLVHRPGVDIEGLRGQIAELTTEVDPLSEGVSVECATVEIDQAAGGDEQVASGVVYALNRFRGMKTADGFLEDLSSNISTLARKAVAEVGRIQEMITGRKFEIVFQPILNIRSGAIQYFETLSRLPENSGFENVYKSVTFAEQTGLVTALDLAVLSKLLNWLDKNTARNGKTCFSINVSGHSISSLSYLAQVDRLLKANTWLRDRLIFEITESGRISDIGAAANFVQQIRQQGFRVALDDFGAGAANFEYLTRIEVDIIKFDGATLNAATKARSGKAFVKALVAFARELGVSTVAEMVGDEAALQFAASCGVQCVQGFLFGEPRRDLRSLQEAVPYHLFPERMKLNARAPLA